MTTHNASTSSHLSTADEAWYIPTAKNLLKEEPEATECQHTFRSWEVREYNIKKVTKKASLQMVLKSAHYYWHGLIRKVH